MRTSPYNIQRVDGYDKDAFSYYPVFVIGAGESGIAMGCRLKQVLGFDQFRIFERQAGVGGTWWINRYPGVACDVPATFYSFSFAPNHSWTSFHPSGTEIVQYMHDVCQQYQIFDKIQCNTDVSELRWLETEMMWEVTLVHMVPGTGDLSRRDREARIKREGRQSVFLAEEKVRAKVVVSCVGGIVEPKTVIESTHGFEKFKGPVLHSARWDPSVSLVDKHVVVVGTGCSAAQIVPRLPRSPYSAKSVTQLMRSAPWVIPRPEAPGGDEGFAKWAPRVFYPFPILAKILRSVLFLAGELHYFTIFSSSKLADHGRPFWEWQSRSYTRKTAPKEYHEILQPDHRIGCKRRIFDPKWLSSLADPKIELTMDPLVAFQERSITLRPKASHMSPEKSEVNVSEVRQLPADVIVCANGFETTACLSSLKVTGKDGREIHDVWDERGGPQAYMGSAMDGFPNLFLIYGPNTVTGHGSVMFTSECMVEYVIKFVRHIIRGEVSRFEIKKEKEIAWAENTQRELQKTIFHTGGCTSWYKATNGWNPTAWPRSQIEFWLWCLFPIWSDWDIEYTRRGIIKRQITWTLRIASAFIVVAILISIRQNSRQSFSEGFQHAAELGRTQLGQSLQMAADWIGSS